MIEGLPPNNAAHIMRLVADEITAKRIADIVTETFDPAETAASAFEIEDDTVTWNAKLWTAEVYFGFAPDETAIRELLASAIGAELAQKVEFSTIDEKDWVAASLHGLAPVRAGRFLVHGSHDRAMLRINDTAIEIEAALAFGTGHHGTTRGCLLLLDRLLKREKPRQILDVGTGTGVLAIAAAKRLKRTVYAGDIDSIATQTARNNAIFNATGMWVRPATARGVEHPALRKNAPYDLVLANILQRPLMKLAPSIAEVTAPHGSLILSGLLKPDVAGVVSAYRTQGFALMGRTDLEGWVALLMRRGGENRRI
jgi:ribosomal protein L11 methyltransferase